MSGYQYIVDEVNIPQAVVLPMKRWHKILEELEELEDIRAYDAAISQQQERIPFAQAVREIDKETQG